jgi:membrane protease subunit HflK
MEKKDLDLTKVLKFFSKLGGLGIIIVLAAYLATGTYTVGPDETAVVLTFGRYSKEQGSGMGWHFPRPIGRVYKIKSTKVYRAEIGFRTVNPGPPAEYMDVPEESLMLTKDENIVELDMIVQYKISDVKNFLFNLKDPEKMIMDATQASIRAVVGNNDLENILTVGKGAIQDETKKMLQDLLDKYDSGIFVENVQLQDVQPPQQVRAAFKDVASAREDKARYINEANGYRNDILPKALGEAQKINNEALAFKEERINKAIGDTSRFLKLYEGYKSGEEANRTRLYLETLEKTLPNVDKVIIDKEVETNLINILGEGGIKSEK